MATEIHMTDAHLRIALLAEKDGIMDASAFTSPVDERHRMVSRAMIERMIMSGALEPTMFYGKYRLTERARAELGRRRERAEKLRQEHDSALDAREMA